MKPRIYVETTLVSYLASRPATDLRSAARQVWSHDFWQWAQESALLYTSALTKIESSRGHPDVAERRMAYVDVCEMLVESEDARTLAKLLIVHKAIPETEPEDALHFAIAITSGMDYVASWNFAHLVGEQPKLKFAKVLQQLGYAVPILANPESILETLRT